MTELLLAFALAEGMVTISSIPTFAEAPPPAGFIVQRDANGELKPICVECGMPIREGYIKPRPGAAMPSLEERAISGILNDDSLRPGDLVMFPDGLKVFQGGSVPYAIESFRRQPSHPRQPHGIAKPQTRR